MEVNTITLVAGDFDSLTDHNIIRSQYVQNLNCPIMRACKRLGLKNVLSIGGHSILLMDGSRVYFPPVGYGVRHLVDRARSIFEGKEPAPIYLFDKKLTDKEAIALFGEDSEYLLSDSQDLMLE